MILLSSSSVLRPARMITALKTQKVHINPASRAS